MKRILCGWVVCLFVLGAPSLMAQTPDTLKILFIYGSRPARGSEGERKWFGGLNGGHVGIQLNADSVLNFSPRLYYWKIFGIRIKRYRLIPVPFRKNSRFFIKTEDKTWRTFPGTVYPDSLRRRVISIPVSPAQMEQLRNLVKEYTAHTPYDYAFLGMRCASASYKILAAMKIVPDYKHKTWHRIFIPRSLRRRLCNTATAMHWPNAIISPGCQSRVWEKE